MKFKIITYQNKYQIFFSTSQKSEFLRHKVFI